MISKYEFFKQSIRQFIQSSELDVGIVYFIIKDIYKEIENTYYAQLNKEAMESVETSQNDETMKG